MLFFTVDTIYLLLAGSSFGNLLFPLFLCFSAPSENRVLIAFIFFSTLLLVLLYVCMMNVQAQIERIKRKQKDYNPTVYFPATQDRLKIFITRFFSGENLLKRTRSIRPLISRLRPNSYRRFKYVAGGHKVYVFYRERRAMRRGESHVPRIQVTAGSPMAIRKETEVVIESCI